MTKQYGEKLSTKTPAFRTLHIHTNKKQFGILSLQNTAKFRAPLHKSQCKYWNGLDGGRT